MRYDISNQKAPEMPNLGKGTECIKLLLSQTSIDEKRSLIYNNPPLFRNKGGLLLSRYLVSSIT